MQSVSLDFHKTFGIPLTRGRLFTQSDAGSSAPVAVINGAMARQYWPDVDPVGKSVRWIVGRRDLTVVGVVADVRQSGLATPSRPTFYVPIAQAIQPAKGLAFAVRVQGDPLMLAPSVRDAIADVDRTLPLFGLQLAEDILARSTAPQRFNVFIVAVFALAALALAALGLYAVISYIVGLSIREFGIRIALGATPAGIVGLIMARGLRLLGMGIVVGVVAAAGLTRLMSSLLYGIQPTDVLTFGGVVGVLAIVSILAMLAPALRVTRVNPISALRQE
jgi:predicted lysophospholipase L1 biosynthesis ABC-type transport system permease subunit